MLPNFMIIGAQKSASTFVHECLREHPDVFMPKGETPFFEDPFYAQSDIEQLEALFNNVKDETMLGIKRPDYLGEAECPARIHKHIPDPKFIVILRNPVERAISAYYWYMRMGYIPTRPLEEGMRDIVDGLYEDQYPKSREIIRYGLYYQHIKRYLCYFDRENFLIMFHSDFRADSLQSMKRVYRFLSVKDDHVPKSLHKRPKRSIYSLARIQLSRLRNPYIHTYYTYDGNMMNFLPKKNAGVVLVKGVFYLIDRLLFEPVCDNARPELSVYLRTKLLDVYIKDINGLERFLGQELPEWKKAT